MRDITTDLLAGAQLAPEMWRSLDPAIPDMLLVVDRDGRILVTRSPEERVILPDGGTTFELVFPATTITEPLEIL